MIELEEKKLLARAKSAIKGRVVATNSFGRNFAKYARNSHIPVPGTSPEDKDHNERWDNAQKNRQRRPMDEGVFGRRKPDGSLISDYPLVHAYATGYNHPVFSGRGDVEHPKRGHVVGVGKQRIPANGQRHISNFEDALLKNGHDVETAHVHGANHSYDFHNNPTKHDEVLPNSARDLVRKTKGDGMQAAMHGVATVRALFRKPDKPKL